MDQNNPPHPESALRRRKLALYAHWKGDLCSCGQPKGRNHWQCKDCKDKPNPLQDQLAAACEAHMLAAEAYLESLKPHEREPATS
jgi:hypothetical protein